MIKERCTSYGILKGILSCDYNLDGEISSCVLNKKNEIVVGGKKLVPIYENYSVRRKDTFSVKFYEDGYIKAICLQDKEVINTIVGDFEVEKITFYNGEKIKRLFLLDGKLTGYWSEEDEYNLAVDYKFSLKFAEFTAKVISLQFYEDGNLKSLTLWPKEEVNIQVGGTLIAIRIGISLYNDGKLKSCEPKRPTKVKTIIGEITAYDINAIGIHGERNSLVFNEEGNILSLITSNDNIEVFDENDKLIKRYFPKRKQHHIVGTWDEIETIKIEFTGENVIFNGVDSYEINKHKFKINDINKKGLILTGDLFK